MKNPNEPQNFFDLRTITALVLVAATFLGWQYYMHKKYPEAFKKKDAIEGVTAQDALVQDAKSAANPVQPPPAIGADTPEASPKAQDEKLFNFESQTFAFAISSKGMGLRNVEIRQFKDRTGKPIVLGHPDQNSLPLETRLIGRNEPIDFEVQKINDNLFVGRGRAGGVEITKTMEISPEKYLFRVKIATAGTDDAFLGVTTVLAEEVEPVASGSFLMPQFEQQEFYMDAADTHERLVFTKDDVQKTWNQVRVASVGSQYFTQAVIDKSPIIPEAKARVAHASKVADILLQYPVLNKNDGLKLEYLAFLGPKSHNLLMSVDESLAKVVNFGFFNFIARQILAMLQWFHALVGNWGVAIILLTIVVRILVFPFAAYSQKSMKKMQAIQPRLQELRERYKDDQQKQQQQIMALMKDNQVNPIGGCLPVFLQFPVFIALYQVLGHSVELYQAPFGLWIHDLSLKDPYYILPVLMGVTMFVQTKMTPSTMDPAQAKIFLFMPVIFTFFMISLPSGLTLYMFIGALFSVIQQYYLMRDSKPLQTASK